MTKVQVLGRTKLDEALRELQETPTIVELRVGQISFQEEIDELAKMFNERCFLLKGLSSPAINIISDQKKMYSERLTFIEDKLEKHLSGMRRAQTAFDLGYSPFTPNKMWYGGFIEKPSSERIAEYTREVFSERITSRPYLLFQQAVPMRVWEKYKEAEGLNVFDLLMVYSPHKEDFVFVEDEVKVTQIPRPTDPILVGYVGIKGPAMAEYHYEEFKGVKTPENKVISFCITQWDLGRDLEAMETKK